ncbi:aminopeptidase [Natronobacterium gregoryi]|uniref:Aminopeptidase n=2 Tax=Natronobacterium gregoryi TaxID=44930 RepID=L0AHT1_NATGS|nr:aminopeptidase [Natronobacterium gregoryi]AFZ73004.1 leucyl aminopeptidase (aminopeptidase T) [Natronobacterium gregoryi SP2]ELY70119.1 peptidase M29 aminopeptidase II [Natronobacterium gregoryi SP2]PLK18059.1 aminopeptidase [Natronobacterium gregoryi SP2]SFJ74572.1 aminopeptidase [Natronobacterium gregoryi]
MDPRIREHAEIIANHSVDLGEGDNVVVDAHPVAEDLVVALHEVIGEKGANPITTSQRTGKRQQRAYLRATDDDFETPEHELALIENTDVYIAIRASDNVTQTSDVDPETSAAYQQAHQPILEERLGTRWCLTQFPAPANAQLAEMSTEGYENFVWDAVNKDWDEQRDHQANMVEIMDPADEIRIVSGDTTDVTMSIAGNPTINDHGENNLPGGEVFTAPQPDSVEGEVLFDMPLYHQGREITDVYLEFEGGEVVSHSAAKNEETLTEVLNTDEGARRLGELGIGMNRDIDQFTYNMLFDEKMGDTVHMAVGRAYDGTVGEGNEQNDSAAHVDMIVDMSEESFIEVDGEVVQRDGTFVFEDGFEA